MKVPAPQFGRLYVRVLEHRVECIVNQSQPGTVEVMGEQVDWLDFGQKGNAIEQYFKNERPEPHLVKPFGFGNQIDIAYYFIYSILPQFFVQAEAYLARQRTQKQPFSRVAQLLDYNLEKWQQAFRGGQFKSITPHVV